MTPDQEVDRSRTVVPRSLLEAVHAHTRDTTSAATRAATKRRVLERLSHEERSSAWQALIPVLAGAALVLCVVGGAWWTARSPRSSAVTSDSASASATPPPLGTVVIRAFPPSTRLTWDGRPITNPASFSAARDGAAHQLVADAPGYEEKTETILVDATEVEVELELAPDPTASPPAP